MYANGSYDGDLKVVILSDKDGWYAQGMEIDHSAEASTLDDVKHVFEDGLASLVTRHLSARGTLDGMLKGTPADTWSDLWSAGKVFNVSSTNFKDHKQLKSLPFSGISYFEQVPWAAKVSYITQWEEEKADRQSTDQQNQLAM